MAFAGRLLAFAGSLRSRRSARADASGTTSILQPDFQRGANFRADTVCGARAGSLFCGRLLGVFGFSTLGLAVARLPEHVGHRGDGFAFKTARDEEHVCVCAC